MIFINEDENKENIYVNGNIKCCLIKIRCENDWYLTESKGKKVSCRIKN